MPITVTAVIVTCIHALRRPNSFGIIEDLRYVFHAVESLCLLERGATDSYLRPVTTTCQSLHHAARRATRACSNTSAEDQDHVDVQTSASERTFECNQDVFEDTLTSSMDMQTRSTSTGRSEGEYESNLYPQDQGSDVGYGAWDQSLSVREMIPWEFDNLLGESISEFFK